MSKVKSDLNDEIANRKTKKVEESRKQSHRKAHLDAEDRFVCSDTIIRSIMRSGTEDGAQQWWRDERRRRSLLNVKVCYSAQSLHCTTVSIYIDWFKQKET